MLTKDLGVLHWSEAFSDFLDQYIGTRNILIRYVTRADKIPQGAIPDQETDKAHTTEHGSVAKDLVAFATHAHPRYQDGNMEVYNLLEKATRGSQYASTLKAYQREKDGHAAMSSIMSQFAGQDKWDAKLKSSQALLSS